jgi:predicted nucleic acid-binding protein
VIRLDTSFLVDLLREQSRGKDGPATGWLDEASASPLAVSVIVRCELEAGAANAAHPIQEREKIRSLLATVAAALPAETFSARYGETLVQIHRASKAISTMDLLIATMALDAGASLLTGDRRHVDVVPDLTVLGYR